MRAERRDARASGLISSGSDVAGTPAGLLKSHKRTAKVLAISKDCGSRRENVATLLPTLRKNVEAMPGKLALVAEFSDREPVALSGIAEVEPSRVVWCCWVSRRPSLTAECEFFSQGQAQNSGSYSSIADVETEPRQNQPKKL